MCICLVALSGCRTHSVPTPVSPTLAVPNDYVDLQAGWRLRVVIPPSRGDFIDYETAYYAVMPQRQAGVWIQFQSAAVTKDGNTMPEAKAPASLSLPPRRMKHARLLYLLRVSLSDHNMALIAARRKEILNASTRAVQSNPAACRSGDDVFCTWIPAGIAVRPEKPQSSDGTWVPAH